MVATNLWRCAIFLSIGAASGIHVDGSSHDLFLPRSDNADNIFHLGVGVSSWTSSLESFGAKGLEHFQKSWMMVQSKLDKSDRHPEKVGKRGQAVVSKPNNEKAIPANRQQMYFRPVSVTLICVMCLTIASLLVYTALSISRNRDELSATFTPSTITQTLTIASRVANFAPMLCMLFVACRMYILATTEGLGEPPAWAKACMCTAVAGVALQFLVVICLPAFSKTAAQEDAAYDMTEGAMAAYLATHSNAAAPADAKKVPATDAQPEQTLIEATGEYTDVHPDFSDIECREGASSMKYVFWNVQILSLVLLYGSIIGVCVCILTFPAQTTKVSPAIICTITLAKLYFIVCLLLWIAGAMPQSDFQEQCKRAALSMSGVTKKAPMFAVLFLASRMRALNLDPPYGMPPFWMQCCFYGITGLVCLETVGAAMVGFTGDMKKAYYGVYIFTCDRPFFHYIEHIPAMTSYLLLIPVIYGVTLMSAADGHPAPLSTTLRCVVWFQGLYFSVMFLQSMFLFSEEANKVDRPMRRDAAVAAGISLSLAPLLSILFVATRMRALQITQQQGAPPGWAQDCMLIALFATGVQALCCLVMPIFVGSSCKVDEDGNPDYDLEPMIGAYAVATVKYVALFALHGSVVMICISVFVMTPETAHEGGRFITSRTALFKGLFIMTCVFFVALLLSSAKVIGMAIKIAIESADRAFLGVDVTIEKCALNFFKGYVQINKLKVHQPTDEIIYKKNEKGKLEGTPTLVLDDRGIRVAKKNEWKYDYIARVHVVLIKINLWRLLRTRGKEFELENLSLTGLYLNVEKPNTDMKEENTNVEYITHYLSTFGGVPPPEEDKTPGSETQDDAKKPQPTKQEAANKTDEATKTDEAKTKDDEGKEKSSTKIILHKIALGDIGVAVTVKNVKLLGEISFQPSMGKIVFDDIQRDVFSGRDDLTPGQTVACVVRAIAGKIFNQVAHEIPHKIMEAAKEAVTHSAAGQVVAGLGSTFASGWHRLTGQHEENPQH